MNCEKNINWDNGYSIQLVRSHPTSTRRPYLLYIAADSSTQRIAPELENPFRTFDVAVRYHSSPAHQDRLFLLSEYVLTGGLSKFDSAAKFFEATKLMNLYQGFIFMDGDLHFEREGINTLFELANAYKFDLAQAALSRDSYLSWPTTLVRPSFDARETSFVEVMAPYFSREALKLTLPTFTESISGYGLDFAWSKILAEHKIGIVDRVVMQHRKPIDRTGGDFYQYLNSLGIEPMHEQRQMRQKYDISSDWRPYDIAGYVNNAENKSVKLRVPLLQLGRRLVHYSWLQDRLAIAISKTFGTGKIVCLSNSAMT